jgi:hypothetical protein
MGRWANIIMFNNAYCVVCVQHWVAGGENNNFKKHLFMDVQLNLQEFYNTDNDSVHIYHEKYLFFVSLYLMTVQTLGDFLV